MNIHVIKMKKIGINKFFELFKKHSIRILLFIIIILLFVNLLKSQILFENSIFKKNHSISYSVPKSSPTIVFTSPTSTVTPVPTSNPSPTVQMMKEKEESPSERALKVAAEVYVLSTAENQKK